MTTEEKIESIKDMKHKMNYATSHVSSPGSKHIQNNTFGVGMAVLVINEILENFSEYIDIDRVKDIKQRLESESSYSKNTINIINELDSYIYLIESKI